MRANDMVAFLLEFGARERDSGERWLVGRAARDRGEGRDCRRAGKRGGGHSKGSVLELLSTRIAWLRARKSCATFARVDFGTGSEWSLVVSLTSVDLARGRAWQVRRNSPFEWCLRLSVRSSDWLRGRGALGNEEANQVEARVRLPEGRRQG